ncbi:hypothetical protein, partial [Cloacibacillus evryensis]|uniref:hypothetical protein n=1 Tax=Cloacibacillus evryensis TaxID=508460 RepID=UPI0026DF29E3
PALCASAVEVYNKAGPFSMNAPTYRPCLTAAATGQKCLMLGGITKEKTGTTDAAPIFFATVRS